MPTLAQYRLEVRRILHDATGRFWSNAELNDYINDSRRRVCSDTGCLRRLLTSYLSQGVEQYPIGIITAIVLGDGGSGYNGTPTVTITGDGDGATAEAVLGAATGDDEVTTLTVTNPGVYGAIPTLSFGGPGTGAAGFARLGLGLYLISAGSGYAVGDEVTFLGGTFTRPAKFVVTVVGGGGNIIARVGMDSGDYSVLPAAASATSTTGAGTGCTFSGMTSGFLTSAEVSAGGSGYVTPPAVTVSGGSTGAITATVGGGSPIASITLLDGGERYTEATVTISGTGTGATATAALIPADTLDILNITPIWGNQRVPMRYMPFTEFNARMRTFFINPQRPCVWSRYGTSGGTGFVQPVPDQQYTTEFDTAVLPPTLEDDDELDVIQYPYTTPVAYYACWRAKMKQQAFSEGEIFLADYKRQLQAAQASVQMRRIPNPYYGYSGA